MAVSNGSVTPGGWHPFPWAGTSEVRISPSAQVPSVDAK
jgi:hypothetical protein